MTSSRIEEMLTQLIRMVGSLQAEFQDMKTEMSGMKSEMSGMKQEMSGMKSEMSGMKQEMSGMKSEMSDMKQEISKTHSRLDRLEETSEKRHVEVLGHIKKFEVDQEIIWKKVNEHDLEIERLKRR